MNRLKRLRFCMFGMPMSLWNLADVAGFDYFAALPDFSR